MASSTQPDSFETCPCCRVCPHPFLFMAEAEPLVWIVAICWRASGSSWFGAAVHIPDAWWPACLPSWLWGECTWQWAEQIAG